MKRDDTLTYNARMRTIKYRGWNQKNQRWLYGFYLQNRGAHFVCPDEFATGKTWEDYEINPRTLGEFTELHDKDGREIYEDDLLEMTLPDGSRRVFWVRHRQQSRMLAALDGFEHDRNPVLIVGWCFSWEGHDLYPSIINGVPDNKRMKVVGTVHKLLRGINDEHTIPEQP